MNNSQAGQKHSESESSPTEGERLTRKREKMIDSIIEDSVSSLVIEMAPGKKKSKEYKGGIYGVTHCETAIGGPLTKAVRSLLKKSLSSGREDLSEPNWGEKEVILSCAIKHLSLNFLDNYIKAKLDYDESSTFPLAALLLAREAFLKQHISAALTLVAMCMEEQLTHFYATVPSICTHIETEQDVNQFVTNLMLKTTLFLHDILTEEQLTTMMMTVDVNTGENLFLKSMIELCRETFLRIMQQLSPPKPYTSLTLKRHNFKSISRAEKLAGDIIERNVLDHQGINTLKYGGSNDVKDLQKSLIFGYIFFFRSKEITTFNLLKLNKQRENVDIDDIFELSMNSLETSRDEHEQLASIQPNAKNEWSSYHQKIGPFMGLHLIANKECELLDLVYARLGSTDMKHLLKKKLILKAQNKAKVRTLFCDFLYDHFEIFDEKDPDDKFGFDLENEGFSFVDRFNLQRDGSKIVKNQVSSSILLGALEETSMHLSSTYEHVTRDFSIMIFYLRKAMQNKDIAMVRLLMSMWKFGSRNDDDLFCYLKHARDDSYLLSIVLASFPLDSFIPLGIGKLLSLVLNMFVRDGTKLDSLEVVDEFCSKAEVFCSDNERNNAMFDFYVNLLEIKTCNPTLTTEQLWAIFCMAIKIGISRHVKFFMKFMQENYNRFVTILLSNDLIHYSNCLAEPTGTVLVLLNYFLRKSLLHKAHLWHIFRTVKDIQLLLTALAIYKLRWQSISYLFPSYEIGVEICKNAIHWNKHSEVTSTKLREQQMKTSPSHTLAYILSNLSYPTAASSEEALEVTKSVDLLVRTLVEKIMHNNQKLECTPILVGSAKEGSRCYRPNEFDYLLLFHRCSELVQKQLTSMQGKGHDIEGDRYLSFLLDEEIGPSICDSIYAPLLSSIRAILKQKAFCVHENLYIDDLRYLKEGAFPCLLLKWDGKHFPNMQITMDIVPCIPFDGNVRLPLHTYMPENCPLFLSVRRFKSNHCMAYSEIETSTVKALPQNIREGYRLSKAIRAANILAPLAGKLLELGVASDVEELIKSYYLKTCLLHLTQHLDKNKGTIDNSPIDWALKIYQRLHKFLLQGNLPNFFQVSQDTKYTEVLFSCDKQHRVSYSRFLCCRRREAMLLTSNRIISVLKIHQSKQILEAFLSKI